MSGVLINAGAILGLWGILWLMWDNRSMSPGWLLCSGLSMVVIGEILENLN